jgi:hypothetical protein
MVRIKIQGAFRALGLLDTETETDTETSEESVGSATPSSQLPETPATDEALTAKKLDNFENRTKDNASNTREVANLGDATMASVKMSTATMESSVRPENPPSILDNLPISDEASEVSNEDPMMTKNKWLKYKQRRRDGKARAQSGNDNTSGSSHPHSHNSTSTVTAGSVSVTSSAGVPLSPSQAAHANSTTAVMSTPTDQEKVATQLNDLKPGDKVTNSTRPISGDGVPANPSKAMRVEPKKSNKKKKSTISGTGSSSTSTSIILPATKSRFGFDGYRDQLKCRKHGCDKLTNCYDGDTLHCP